LNTKDKTEWPVSCLIILYPQEAGMPEIASKVKSKGVVILKTIKSWPEKSQKKEACGSIGDMIKGKKSAQIFKLTQFSNSGG
jgi:hypothetical protein